MSKPVLGIICGLVFGIIDVIIMIPLKYEDNRKRVEAMAGAFIERFMLGFIIPTADIGVNPIATGVILGFGFSLPTSIITRVYIPINAIGIVGGLIIGIITKYVIY